MPKQKHEFDDDKLLKNPTAEIKESVSENIVFVLKQEVRDFIHTMGE